MKTFVTIMVLIWFGLLGAYIALKFVERKLGKDNAHDWDEFCRTGLRELHITDELDETPSEDLYEMAKQASAKLPRVAYICDGHACEECTKPICNHTTDIRHAQNFECIGGEYYERFEEETECASVYDHVVSGLLEED